MELTDAQKEGMRERLRKVVKDIDSDKCKEDRVLAVFDLAMTLTGDADEELDPNNPQDPEILAFMRLYRMSLNWSTVVLGLGGQNGPSFDLALKTVALARRDYEQMISKAIALLAGIDPVGKPH